MGESVYDAMQQKGNVVMHTTKTHRTRRQVLALLAGTSGTALLAACGNGRVATAKPAATATAAVAPTATRSPAVDAMQTLVIEAVDYGYRTSGSVTAGPVRVQLKNLGTEPHHAQFMLLNPGVTMEQFVAASKKGPEGTFPLVTFRGGPGAVAPMSQTEVVLDLPTGQYVISCFVESADHVAHVAKGMTLPLTVMPSSAPAPMPIPAATLTLVDFAFEMPTTLPAGRTYLQVVNKGPQIHEFNIVRLAPGKTLDDVKAFFDPAPGTPPPAGPPPALPIGGMNGLTPGQSGLAVLDLMPGQYAAVCNVPDQSVANGASHLHLGMIKGFAVP